MDWPELATFARRPRNALMWVPRALDLARIRAALSASGPRVVDVGAGTGLLAALLRLPVDAVDPTPPAKRYHEILPAARGPYDAAIVSWMEAGKDYRADVATMAPVIVNAYDVEGGCGVMGQVDFAPFGFVEAASWRTASFEDAAYALDHRGALVRRGWPGNRVDVLTREPARAPALRAAVEGARAGSPLPWEAEMDRLRL
ncbi:MAG TPA: hypothetical protein VM370_10840 [Candidatus Thermoplasmatota archaeon]|nr:hypothetical protein [Candidatus Thermoplasmatota archaeon]